MNSINYYSPEGVGFGSNSAYLRKVLNVMFPSSYISSYHIPPNSICTLLSTSQNRIGFQHESTSNTNTYEASTEPISRANLINFRNQFNDSLIEHQAKQAGLCPIRRAIYDQCFGRLTVLN